MPNENSIGRRLARGAGIGIGATALLSLLSRVPAIRNALDPGHDRSRPKLPQNRFDRAQVRAWQEASWSPAARQPLPINDGGDGVMHIGPATALRQAQAPGPEGLAEQFAFKVASGLFDRNIAASLHAYGRVVHATYGTLWGVLYNLFASDRSAARPAIGALYGLGIYVIGPALLLPAMRIVAKPRDEEPLRTSVLIAAHLIYGIALSTSLAALRRTEHGTPAQA
jgi:uncharacterized membrane protein YagU involved in acid resistance